MHRNQNTTPSPICSFMPSYSSYEGIGGSCATGLSNLVELIIRLMSSLRR